MREGSEVWLKSTFYFQVNWGFGAPAIMLWRKKEMKSPVYLIRKSLFRLSSRLDLYMVYLEFFVRPTWSLFSRSFLLKLDNLFFFITNRTNLCFWKILSGQSVHVLLCDGHWCSAIWLACSETWSEPCKEFAGRILIPWRFSPKSACFRSWRVPRSPGNNYTSPKSSYF